DVQHLLSEDIDRSGARRPIRRRMRKLFHLDYPLTVGQLMSTGVLPGFICLGKCDAFAARSYMLGLRFYAYKRTACISASTAPAARYPGGWLRSFALILSGRVILPTYGIRKV